MENAGYHNEETKKSQLEEQPHDDDLLTSVEQLKRSSSLYAASPHLYKEAYDITGHENLREPLLANYSVFFAVNEENNATKDDVYRCGKQSGCNKQQ